MSDPDPVIEDLTVPEDVRIHPAKHAPQKEKAVAKESQSPTWRWVAGGALAVVGFLVALWMDSVASANADTADATKQLVTLVGGHGERLAAVEAQARSADARQERIERTVDRVEMKLDRALEKK